MHLNVANSLVGLKDLLGQHIFKELCTRYRKVTVHVLLYVLFMGRTLTFLQKKNKAFSNQVLEKT